MQTRINGLTIDYSITGTDGPWVLLSHSLGCTQSMWDAQMDALAGNCRVLRYDTRGHGRTDAPTAPYTLEQLADDALALLDHLQIAKVHWVGFSMGGMIGQVFALRHPERLASLVLADTTSAHTATPVSLWEARIQTARTQGIGPLVQPAIGRWFTESFRTREPKETARIAAMIAATPVEGWCGCCAAIAAIDTTEQLYRINCPVLILVGEHDVGTPVSAALEMQRHLPQATLVLIADAAHMSNIEQPAQFNRALGLFLDRHAVP